uniref:Cadherin domain-containing protein n=1 Tax=Sinocyclocheilus rhinocerous TaxID=307959 RepID=A0A673KZI9_9TELE
RSFYLISALGQVSYSIPEEMAKGSLVGNIAQDLGLDLKRLKSGKARIYTGDSAEYIELNKERGVLLIKERIDREALCGQTTPCALHFQIILENPMQLYRITVEVTDINDNAPMFSKSEMRFEINEMSLAGARFILERAIDHDVGGNGLQSYSLEPTDNFVLKFQNLPNGNKAVEMVLQTHLDREKKDHISLLLTAFDGVQMSGTMLIHITVLDANDNAPVCSQSVYKASIAENSAKGTVLTTVSASDADQGSNGVVTYSLSSAASATLFDIGQYDVRSFDYEQIKAFADQRFPVPRKSAGRRKPSSQQQRELLYFMTFCKLLFSDMSVTKLKVYHFYVFCSSSDWTHSAAVVQYVSLKSRSAAVPPPSSPYY